MSCSWCKREDTLILNKISNFDNKYLEVYLCKICNLFFNRYELEKQANNDNYLLNEIVVSYFEFEEQLILNKLNNFDNKCLWCSRIIEAPKEIVNNTIMGKYSNKELCKNCLKLISFHIDNTIIINNIYNIIEIENTLKNISL